MFIKKIISIFVVCCMMFTCGFSTAFASYQDNEKVVEIELTKDIAQALKGTFHGFRGKITVKTCVHRCNRPSPSHRCNRPLSSVPAQLHLEHIVNPSVNRDVYSRGTYTFRKLLAGPYVVSAVQKNGKKGWGDTVLHRCTHKTISINSWYKY
jgi:hypothetical protein